MQYKFIAATIAALSVGSAIAGPLPVPAQDNGLVAREAAPVAQPAPEPIEARAAQDIQADQLTSYYHDAYQYAIANAWQVPTQDQLRVARRYYPTQAWQYNIYGINNYQRGWDPRLQYLLYLYNNYGYYYQTWNTYWPTTWDSKNDYNNWYPTGWGN